MPGVETYLSYKDIGMHEVVAFGFIVAACVYAVGHTRLRETSAVAVAAGAAVVVKLALLPLV